MVSGRQAGVLRAGAWADRMSALLRPASFIRQHMNELRRDAGGDCKGAAQGEHSAEVLSALAVGGMVCQSPRDEETGIENDHGSSRL